jgi:hypothetical protein
MRSKIFALRRQVQIRGPNLLNSDPTTPIRVFFSVYSYAVWRQERKKRFVPVYLLYLLAGVAWLGVAPAHGTHVEIIFRNDAAIVAAESRQTHGGPVEEEACKILPLGAHAVFTSTGELIRAERTFTNGSKQVLWNAFDIAHDVFRPSLDISLISDRWAAAMMEKFNSYASTTSSNVPIRDGDAFAQAIFLSDQGDIHGKLTQLVFIKSGANFSRVDTPNFLPDGGRKLFGNPHLELVNEFSAGQTQRAIDSKNEMNKRVAAESLTGADADALMLKATSEFVIKWANDPAIGGAVSVAILERGKALRWFSRSPACGG